MYGSPEGTFKEFSCDCLLVYFAHHLYRRLQIEAVLHKILLELKVLYAQHAPQLKPRTVPQPPVNTDSIDPVEDMYNILEGSALIPYLEVFLFNVIQCFLT